MRVSGAFESHLAFSAPPIMQVLQWRLGLAFQSSKKFSCLKSHVCATYLLVLHTMHLFQKDSQRFEYCQNFDRKLSRITYDGLGLLCINFPRGRSIFFDSCLLHVFINLGNVEHGSILYSCEREVQRHENVIF